MRRPFTKMHGAGNDFVVFDATTVPLHLSAAQAKKIADRHFGIGCDQILLVEPPPPDDSVDFHYRILNSDGSESSQCGNGARCFAHFVRDKGLSNKPSIRVSTAGGRLILEHLPDGQVRVDMGVPDFVPARIPLLAEGRSSTYAVHVDGERIEFGAVSIGNPHMVLRVPDVALAPVASLGPKLECLPEFPARVNVGFMQIVDRDRIRLRVFERGAGETLACGSGACAAVAVGRENGWLDANVAVELPGGTLKIEWAGDFQELYMTGPAAAVFEGEIEL